VAEVEVAEAGDDRQCRREAGALVRLAIDGLIRTRSRRSASRARRARIRQ
jgi:hypothetical protein